jgi:hypothetical protein
MTTPPDDTPDGAPEAAPEPVAAAEPPKRRRRWKLYLWLVLLTPVLLLALYTLLAYNWSYSSGDRSGILRKFSQKGWLCKTWEGELAMTTVPGVMPELWAFTVRGNEAAAKVNAALGRQVVLHYEEHRGLWNDCFGETDYFVDSVRVIE